MLRTGCMCNPGACAAALGLSAAGEADFWLGLGAAAARVLLGRARWIMLLEWAVPAPLLSLALYHYRRRHCPPM